MTDTYAAWLDRAMGLADLYADRMDRAGADPFTDPKVVDARTALREHLSKLPLGADSVSKA